MKKILSLSLITCSVFSMQLDLMTSQSTPVIPNKKAIFKSTTNCIDPKLNLIQFSSHDNKSIYNNNIQPLTDQFFVINKKALFIPQRLGNISVCYNNNEFSIKKDQQLIPIQRCFIDKELRGISKENLNRLLTSSAYLVVNKINKNEYSLKLNGRLLGGGVVGATTGFYIGKFLTHFVAHTAILIAGACTGPLAPATIASLEATFLPVIEATSNTVGLAGGILGGITTGPV